MSSLSPQLKKYQKKDNYSYTLGIYPTLELLESKSEKVLKVVISESGRKNTKVQPIVELCKENNIRVEFNNKAIRKVAIKENTYVVGWFSKYIGVLDSGKSHVVLVNPVDTGNLGTIIRTMAAFDFKNLAIISPGVDIFSPKVIRSAMGAFFKVNVQYFESFELYQQKFPDYLAYGFVLNKGESIQKVKFKHPASLVFGNENQGLQKEIVEVCSPVYSPQSKNIDSLNLSAAVAIALNNLHSANFACF